MSQTTQSMLFLIRQAPYSTSLPAAAMDLLLTAAAFDQDVSLVFSDDGVYHLLKGQDNQDLGLKNISKILPALELYEVNKILVEESALLHRGLQQADCIIPVDLINNTALSRLLESVDQVFSF